MDVSVRSMDNYVVATYVPAPVILYEANPNCSCVEYAKRVLGRQGDVWGNAWEITPTTDTPSVGAVIITTDGRGHVGVVISFGDETVTFTESNYYSCKISQRTLDRDDARITGYKEI